LRRLEGLQICSILKLCIGLKKKVLKLILLDEGAICGHRRYVYYIV